MKTIIIIVLAMAIALTVCFFIGLVRNKRTKKNLRWSNFILPIIALLLFLGLFVGSSISRNSIRNELKDMKENTDKRIDGTSRLSVLEARNNDLSLIIGNDESLESLIEEIRR